MENRLEMIRKKKGLTKKQVAKYLGISPEGYGYYENGKRNPNIDVITSLARFYDVSTDYLLGLTEDKKRISDSDATEILTQKLIEYGFIKPGEDLTNEQLDELMKKAAKVIKAFYEQ